MDFWCSALTSSAVLGNFPPVVDVSWMRREMNASMSQERGWSLVGLSFMVCSFLRVQGKVGNEM